MLRLLKAHVLGEKGLTRLYATGDTLDFFRLRREKMALEAAKPKRGKKKAKGKRRRAELVHDALIRHGFDAAEATRAIEALDARIETDRVEVLVRDALAFLASGATRHTDSV
jgi:Holliday junction resolvasome RuvABC DNA-binding subunit